MKLSLAQHGAHNALYTVTVSVQIAQRAGSAKSSTARAIRAGTVLPSFHTMPIVTAAFCAANARLAMAGQQRHNQTGETCCAMGP